VDSTATVTLGALLSVSHFGGRKNHQSGQADPSSGLSTHRALFCFFVCPDKRIHLTAIECKLLTTLVRHAGVVTHRQLLKEVWGPLHVEEGHDLRMYMRQMRNKLENNPANPWALSIDSKQKALKMFPELAGDQKGL
jgi:DNA-binding response OmpR family regulator